MRIGASLFLIAVGAILTWAITAHISGVNVHVVGVILMLVGLTGLLIDLYLWNSRRGSAVVTHSPDVVYVDPVDPVDRF